MVEGMRQALRGFGFSREGRLRVSSCRTLVRFRVAGSNLQFGFFGFQGPGFS